MKRLTFLLGALPALLAAGPPGPADALRVAVLDFESGAGCNPGDGPAVAAMVRADIAVLPPLVSVDRGRLASAAGAGGPPVAPGTAADIGRRAGAVAVVTGRVVESGSGATLDATVANPETGAAVGITVRREPSATFADAISELSLKIAAAVTGQGDLQAAKSWPRAAIRGSRKAGSRIFGKSEVACVAAVDSRPVARETEAWAADLALSPGRHRIMVLYSSGEWAARAVLDCDARPASGYEVRAERDGEQSVRFWIEDRATGRPATEVKTVSTEGGFRPGIIMDRRLFPGN